MGFERLKDRINETGISQRAIADALDTFPSTISTKITNGGVWKLEDICTICAMLDIPPGEIFLYFLSEDECVEEVKLTKLYEAIRKQNGTLKCFANLVGMDKEHLVDCLCGRDEFTVDEVAIIVKTLKNEDFFKINDRKLKQYFC